MTGTVRAAVPLVAATVVTLAATQWWLLPSTNQAWDQILDPGDLAGMFIVWVAVLGATHFVMTGPRRGIEKLALAVIVLMAIFGIGWEVTECAAGRHFGSHGNGSNPFDQICPFTKTGGTEPANPGETPTETETL